MSSPLKQSPLDRLAITRPVRRVARTRLSRMLGFTELINRRNRRFRNRQIGTKAQMATRRLLTSDRAQPVDDIGPLRADESSSISTRFIVLSEGRSGSTLLVDELDRRWPEIRSRKEEFNKSQREKFGTFENLARHTFIEETGEAIVGCKIFAVQISDQELASLLSLEGMRIVFLRRRNLLRRFVSEQIARKTAEWHQIQFQLRPEPLTVQKRTITIDPAFLFAKLNRSRIEFQRLERATVGLPSIDIWYEELAADLDNELRRVATFLGAGEPVHESPPRLTKQNPEPLRALITNFEEISEFLHDVGMEEFLTLDEAPEDNATSPTPTAGEVPFGQGHSFWPTRSQFLLLRALIGPEGSFKENWSASLSQTPAWTESATVASLYPSIHQRVRLDPHLKADLRNFRAESVRNSALKLKLLNAVRDLTDQLDGSGLGITLLGSSALMALTSDRMSIGFRTLPISGLDLTTEPERFEQVVETLGRLGWSVTPKIATDSDLAANIVTFQRDEIELRLHRTMLRATTTDAGETFELERDLRKGTAPAPSFSAATSLPAAAELLISIIIDGLFALPSGSIEWVLDANRLLADVGENFDWNRFNELTESHRLHTPVHAALALLEDLTDLRQGDRPQ